MNERSITEKVMATTRMRMPSADITKHSDRATSDIPDLSVACLGNTCWVEMKYLRAKEKLIDIIKKGQLIKCHSLATNTNGRAWFMVYEEAPRQLTIWYPRALFAHLYPKFAGPDDDGAKWLAPLNIEHIEQIQSNKLNVLRSHGALRMPGWPMDALYHMVTAANYDARRM